MCIYICLLFTTISNMHFIYFYFLFLLIDMSLIDKMSDIEKLNTRDICLADSATTHTILRNQKYFLNLTLLKANVNTISGLADLIEGSSRAMILLPNNTRICISDALYSSRSKRNLLSFKDIRYNGYHIETISDECREK